MEQNRQTGWRNRRIPSAVLRPCIVVALATLAIALSSPLHADWLVTRSGAKIETSGAWQVKGKLVVFKLPNGTLSSVKVADIDLDKSHEATAQAAEAAKESKSSAPKATPHRKAVMTISDADVEHITGGNATSQQPAAKKAETKSSAAESQSPDATGGLQVGDWQPTNSDDGVGMTGTLHNPGNDTVAGISLEVHLYDPQGKLIATGDAAVAQAALAPHGATTFRVSFPGVFNFTAVKFALKGTRLGTAKPAPASSPTQNPSNDSSDGG